VDGTTPIASSTSRHRDRLVPEAALTCRRLPWTHAFATLPSPPEEFCVSTGIFRAQAPSAWLDEVRIFSASSASSRLGYRARAAPAMISELGTDFEPCRPRTRCRLQSDPGRRADHDDMLAPRGFGGCRSHDSLPYGDFVRQTIHREMDAREVAAGDRQGARRIGAAGQRDRSYRVSIAGGRERRRRRNETPNGR